MRYSETSIGRHRGRRNRSRFRNNDTEGSSADSAGIGEDIGNNTLQFFRQQLTSQLIEGSSVWLRYDLLTRIIPITVGIEIDPCFENTATGDTHFNRRCDAMIEYTIWVLFTDETHSILIVSSHTHLSYRWGDGFNGNVSRLQWALDDCPANRFSNRISGGWVSGLNCEVIFIKRARIAGCHIKF